MTAGAPALSWDGATLHARVATPQVLALHLDGVPFTRSRGAVTELRQGFRFPPGGHACLQFQLHAAGQPLHAPLCAWWGRAGLAPASAPPPALHLPEPVTECTVTAPVALAGAPQQRIIVPVYNAAPAVARCLASLRQHTRAGARLLLVDDASTDPGVAPLLEMARQWPGVELLRNARNLGFTATVNRALARCAPDADVVLLNADTEVGPGWLAGLAQAAWSAPRIATATAVSDNAGAFSVPELERENPLPDGWGGVAAARALLQHAGRVLPRLPTGNGFCMYLRHDARAEVGVLDEAAFPAGYGEENDWCQRAERRGWEHVIAGHVFVRHARSQSFGAARREALGAVGMQVLRTRYPDYEAKVGAQLFSWERLVLDWRVRRLWREGGAPPRPRVLLPAAAAADAWSGWCVWRLRRRAAAWQLLDADGSERARSAEATLPAALAGWLQRYAIEAAAPALGTAVLQLCSGLGIPVATAPEAIAHAFRA